MTSKMKWSLSFCLKTPPEYYWPIEFILMPWHYFEFDIRELSSRSHKQNRFIHYGYINTMFRNPLYICSRDRINLLLKIHWPLICLLWTYLLYMVLVEQNQYVHIVLLLNRISVWTVRKNTLPDQFMDLLACHKPALL